MMRATEQYEILDDLAASHIHTSKTAGNYGVTLMCYSNELGYCARTETPEWQADAPQHIGPDVV